MIFETKPLCESSDDNDNVFMTLVVRPIRMFHSATYNEACSQMYALACKHEYVGSQTSSGWNDLEPILTMVQVFLNANDGNSNAYGSIQEY